MSPWGGSGDEDPEAARAEFEDPDLFANKESDDSKFANKESNSECPPCGEIIPRMLNSPVKPSAEAIAQHFTNGHLPHRNWCDICVRSKGVEAAHRRGANAADADDKGGVPIVGIDYSALNEDISKRKTPRRSSGPWS